MLLRARLNQYRRIWFLVSFVMVAFILTLLWGVQQDIPDRVELPRHHSIEPCDDTKISRPENLLGNGVSINAIIVVFFNEDW